MEAMVSTLTVASPDPWNAYIDSALVWQPLDGLQLPRGAQILDVGSGDGRILKGLRGRGFRATGIELRTGPITDIIGRAEALPFHDETFDLVLLILVLMHVRQAGRALGEVFRVTKQGGHALVAVGNRRSFTGLALREKSPRFLLRKIPYDHYLSYSEGELKSALSAAGFGPLSLRSVTFIPRVVGKAPPSILNGLIPILRRAEDTVSRLPVLRKAGVRLIALAQRA